MFPYLPQLAPSLRIQGRRYPQDAWQRLRQRVRVHTHQQGGLLPSAADRTLRQGDGDSITYPANAGEYQEQQTSSTTSRTVPSIPDADLAEGDYNGQLSQPSPQVPTSTAAAVPCLFGDQLAYLTESRESLRREIRRLQGEDAVAIATAILELPTSTADSTSSMLPALPMADQLQAVDGDSDRLMAT